MCRTRYTPDLHKALADVADDRVVYYPVGSTPMAGFYWRAAPGGYEAAMCEPEQLALDELAHARLIAIGEPPLRRCHGNPVHTTSEGALRLPEWNTQNDGGQQ